MANLESLQAPRRAATAEQPPYALVTVPQQAMWFVDALRRPVTGLATVVDLDRRSLAVEVRRAASSPSSPAHVAKRVFDVVASILLLVALSPLMLAIALVVSMSSRGGPIFVQRRVGLDGSTFPMLKFRSMVLDADQRVDALINDNFGSGPLFKLRQDPRVTKTGRWLRRSSLDELPQLVNVIAGHMSLVGPRPALPREVTQYTPRERRRLAVKPGLTGLWQVSGRSDLAWDDGVRLDLLYVEHWSLKSDMRIIAKTARTLISCRGAY